MSPWLARRLALSFALPMAPDADIALVVRVEPDR